MANPTWPSTLPQYPDDDGSAGYAPIADPIMKSDMDSGTVKYRKRATAIPEQFTGNITLDKTQLATFKTFWDTTIDLLKPFDWKDFRTGDSATYMFTATPQEKSLQGYPGYWVIPLQLLKVTS